MRRAIALLAVVAAAAACSSSSADPASSSPPPSSSTAASIDDAGQDAALAAALCGALRDQTNVLARLANSAVAGIGAMEPADRFTALVGGFDDVEAAGQDFRTAIEALDLPEVPEAGDLRGEISDGAALAVAEVQRVRTAFVALSPLVRDEEVQGRVGQLFNAVEKMMSVVEPAMAGYPRRELRAAFAAEPTCEHVVQPVGDDD